MRKKIPYELPDGDFVKFIEQIHKQSLQKALEEKARATARLNAASTTESPQESLRKIRAQHERTMQSLRSEVHGEDRELLQKEASNQARLNAAQQNAMQSSFKGTPQTTSSFTVPSGMRFTRQGTDDITVTLPPYQSSAEIRAQAHAKREQQRAQQRSLRTGTPIQGRTDILRRSSSSFSKQSNRRKRPSKLSNARSSLLVFWIFLNLVFFVGMGGRLQGEGAFVSLLIAILTVVLIFMQLAISRHNRRQS